MTVPINSSLIQTFNLSEQFLVAVGHRGSDKRGSTVEEFKKLIDTSLCYSNAKSTLLAPLTFIKVEKTKHENFNFVHLSSFPNKHNSKTIWYIQIIYRKCRDIRWGLIFMGKLPHEN